jgi:hypothetical protein
LGCFWILSESILLNGGRTEREIKRGTCHTVCSLSLQAHSNAAIAIEITSLRQNTFELRCLHAVCVVHAAAQAAEQF